MNQKSEPTSSIFEILKKYDIKPNKIMGQNFLIDESILNKILETSNLEPNDIVLEIGPGLGILTLELAKRAKKIIAIEKDKRMCEILREMLDAGDVKNVQVINGDILKMTNDQFSMTNESPSPNYKIVANIPYYLTSPLIRMFLEMKNRPEFMVLMVQKEVAQRICACPQRQQAVLRGGRASPPKMSLLAVSVQFYANPEIISYVSKNAFYPQPNVDSAIIKIVPRESAFRSAIICDKFFKLVKMGFSAKRKMLINNLKKLDVGCLALEDVFEKIGLNPKIRAENLSIDDWTNLFTMLTNKNLL